MRLLLVVYMKFFDNEIKLIVREQNLVSKSEVYVK